MFGASRWLEPNPSGTAIAAAATAAATTPRPLCGDFCIFLAPLSGLMSLACGTRKCRSRSGGWLIRVSLSPICRIARPGQERITGEGRKYALLVSALTGNRPLRCAAIGLTVAIRAVISDFGGVLTTPLLGSFLAFQDQTGNSAEALGRAMQRIAESQGEHPLFELERGRLTEAEFLGLLRAELVSELGHEPELHRFARSTSTPSSRIEPMIDLMRDLKGRGYRMALLTNNVREWEPLWRAMLPVDEIFEIVVDSAFVGIRKPEPEIYELTLERLGGGSSRRSACSSTTSRTTSPRPASWA